MNKKVKYEIILIILIGIVIVNTSIILTSPSNDVSGDNDYNITKLGSNENGTVYKIVAGNMNSEDSVAIILGVHPREHEIHEAINRTVANITCDNGTNNLTKKFIIYYVQINDNITSRYQTREAGELLANQTIVSQIKKDNPFIVVDVHEIDSNYEYSNFIFRISNSSPKVDNYTNQIASDLSINKYQFGQGTSPERVTIPISNQNLTTFLLEVSSEDNLTEKENKAYKLIYCLDNLNP